MAAFAGTMLASAVLASVMTARQDAGPVMRNVLTLIADPTRPSLDHSTIARVARALAGAGALLGEMRPLAPRLACDLTFDVLDCPTAQKAARLALGRKTIDAVAQPLRGRRKALLVADMESTIIANEMLDELADFLGLRRKIAAITARAMNGEIDFAGALRERVALLKGLPASRLTQAARRIRITPGATTLVATMRANGAYCALVSGGFTVFTAAIKQQLGFDFHAANRLKITAHKLSGTVVPPILGKAAKLATLRRLARQQKLKIADTMSVGDGANDLPMLLAAGMGVAYRAKKSVAAAARARIDHGDLTALLYLQGYRRSEFVIPRTSPRKKS